MQNLLVTPKIGFFSVVTLGVILFSGINLEYATKVGLISSTQINDVSKIISILIITALPFVFNAFVKIFLTNRLLMAFIFWVLVTVTFSFAYTQIYQYSVPFSNVTRTFVQMGGFTIGFILGYYVYHLHLYNKQILFNVINYSIILMFLGVLFQILTFGFENILTDRLFGLSGEPKDLGLFVVPYLFSIIITDSKQINLRKYLILICFSCLLLTLSATAFLALIFMFTTYATIYGFLNKRLLITLLVTAPVIFLILLSVPQFEYMLVDRFLMYASGQYIQGVQVPFELPLFGIITVEANDFPVAQFFKENPFFIFTGIGLGQESVLTFHYIQQYGGFGFIDINYAGYITPNSALLQNTASYGLILVSLLAVGSLKMTKVLSTKLKGIDKFIWFFFFSHFFLSLLIFRTAIPLTMSYVILVTLYKYHNRSIIN